MQDGLISDVDDSEPANWAVQVGIKLAKLWGARLALVNVIHDEMAMTPVFALPREDLAQDMHHAGEELLRQTRLLTPEELETSTFVAVGEPSQQIIATVRKWEADLIVLGTHGRAGITHMLIGSTAESVVRQAHCPVMTIGHDPAERALPPHVTEAVLAPKSKANEAGRLEPQLVG